MRITRAWIIGVLVTVVLALALGCSDKQEQADQLEQEMMGQEPAMDTTADTMAVEDDTAGMDSGVDASAVPDEETTQSRTLPPAPAGGGYTVQVAGCEDRAYAEYLIELYTGRGYEPFIEQATVGGQLYYRVRVGSYDTYEGAQALQKEIMSRFSVDGWIDQIGS